ncbi:MAG TPA: pilin [Steroidobacteraceae bacterium]|nr:pilin [Steroidobacteraceae bacterium]
MADAEGARRNGLDARIRWLRLDWPALTTMLEIPVFLIVLWVMIEAALQGLVHVRKSLAALGGESVASGARAAMMEYRAVTGEWPRSDREAGFQDTQDQSSRFSAVTIRSGGAVDVTYSSSDAGLAGKVLSIQAWQVDGSERPVAWLCGHARRAPLAATSEDRTTFTDDELPSTCRAR